MHALKTRVENGRIRLDEPTNLPNGTELYILPAEQLDDVVLLKDDGLEDGERAELLQTIDESLAEADAGQVEDFSQLIAEMRRHS
jgi:uncharacterized protein YpiB (UPF0302 family)